MSIRSAVVVAAIASACNYGYQPPEEPPVEPLPAELVKTAEARIKVLRARAAELDAMKSTIDTARFVPRPDLGACTIKGDYALKTVHAGEALGRPGAILGSKVHAMSSEIEAALKNPGEGRVEKIRKLIEAPPADHAVVFVIDTWRQATFDAHSGKQSFEPGEVRGRAYGWSASAGTVVCAADVVATSSVMISVKGGNQSFDAHYGRNDRNEIRAALDADLRKQLPGAIAQSLVHAAGPPP